jgi:hypothetical protein
MKRLAATVLLTLVMAGCAGRDESAVRALVQQALSAARAGDTAAVIATLDETAPLHRLLADNPAPADALANLRRILEGNQVEILRVSTDGPHARILIRVSAGERGDELSITARKVGEVWRLEDLPALPIR